MGYYYSLKAKILVDSIANDFVPHNDANCSIIRNNKIFESTLGSANKYITGDILAEMCVHNRKDKILEKINCDSVLKVFSLYNIYDSLLFKLDFAEHMTKKISSNSIYSSQNFDTIYIAVKFCGSVIQYENIVYGEQSDYRIIKLDDGTEEFDDSHSLCPFEKYESTIIVLNQVDKLDNIDETQRKRLKLIKSELSELKIFLYE